MWPDFWSCRPLVSVSTVRICSYSSTEHIKVIPYRNWNVTTDCTVFIHFAVTECFVDKVHHYTEPAVTRPSDLAYTWLPMITNSTWIPSWALGLHFWTEIALRNAPKHAISRQSLKSPSQTFPTREENTHWRGNTLHTPWCLWLIIRTLPHKKF